MPDYSAGVILAWRIAAAEAIASKHEFLLREHLMMGLAALEDALGRLLEQTAGRRVRCYQR